MTGSSSLPRYVLRGSQLRPATPDAAEALRGLEGDYVLWAETPDCICLGRDAEHDGGPRLRMAGRLVGRMTVLEVLGALETTGWNGVLHVVGPSVRRSLMIEQGALLYAASDDPADRFGQVLVRAGAVGEAQLEEALTEGAGCARRLGEVLVERGVLDEASVFQYLQRQAEQIFFGALVTERGWYAFVEDTEADPPPVTLHLPVQPLLMEGVQRIDEMELFRQRIPNSAVCPQRVKMERRASLDGRALQVLPLCDGQRNIEEIARATGLGEFETTKVVYHLLQRGLVVLRSGTRIEPERIRAMVEHFNDVMRDVFLAAATYGEMGRAQAKLLSWLGEAPAGAVLGQHLDEDGALDPDDVVERLERLDDAQPLDRLHQALHELATYALVVVGRVLSRREEMELARDVRRRLERLRD